MWIKNIVLFQYVRELGRICLLIGICIRSAVPSNQVGGLNNVAYPLEGIADHCDESQG